MRNKLLIHLILPTIAGKHDHQHAAWAMGGEWVATSLGTKVAHVQQKTNGGWKGYLTGNQGRDL